MNEKIKNTLTGIFAAAAATLALFSTVPATADAAEIGQCFTVPELNAAMKAEGQHLMAYSKAVGNKANSNKGDIIYANPDNRTAYVFDSDAPVGHQINSACTKIKLTDVKFFDTRKPGVPEGALVNADPVKALEKCRKMNNGDCGFHNDTLRTGEKNGIRVFMQGTEQRGGLITLTARVPGDGLGTIMITTGEGAMFMAQVFTDATYTKNLISLFDDPSKDKDTMIAKGQPPMSVAPN